MCLRIHVDPDARCRNFEPKRFVREPERPRICEMSILPFASNFAILFSTAAPLSMKKR